MEVLSQYDIVLIFFFLPLFGKNSTVFAESTKSAMILFCFNSGACDQYEMVTSVTGKAAISFFSVLSRNKKKDT